jgi:hypothetical protein
MVIIVWGGGESVVKNENELDGDDSNEDYPETDPDEYTRLWEGLCLSPTD